MRKLQLKLNPCKEGNDQASKYTLYANVLLYGKSLCSDWFFLGQDFAVRTVSMETVQPV